MEKQFQVPMVRPRKMPGLPEGQMARIAGWLLPVKTKITEILKGRKSMTTFVYYTPTTTKGGKRAEGAREPLTSPPPLSLSWPIQSLWVQGIPLIHT